MSNTQLTTVHQEPRGIIDVTAVPARRFLSRSLTRFDLYAVVALALLVGAFVATTHRYTVTRFDRPEQVIFQRLDRWTGHIELWIAAGTNQQAVPTWASYAPTPPTTQATNDSR